jgi:hypothetical protein
MFNKKRKVKKLNENQLRFLVRKVIAEQQVKTWRDLPSYTPTGDTRDTVVASQEDMPRTRQYKTGMARSADAINVDKMVNDIVDVLLTKKIVVKGLPGTSGEGFFTFMALANNLRTTPGEVLLILKKHFKHIPGFENLFEDPEQILSSDFENKMTMPTGGALGVINDLTPTGRKVANKVAIKLNDILDSEVKNLEAASGISEKQKEFIDSTYRIKKMD